MFLFRNDKYRHNNPKLTKAISVLAVALFLFILFDFFFDNFLNPSYNLDGRPAFLISRDAEIKKAEKQIYDCMDQYGILLRSVFSYTNSFPHYPSPAEAASVSEYLSFAHSVIPDTCDITEVPVCRAFVSNPKRISFLPFSRSRLISASQESIASLQSDIKKLDDWLTANHIPEDYYALQAVHASLKAYLYKLAEYPTACILASYKRSFRYCDTDWDSRNEYSWRTPTAFSGSNYISYFEKLNEQITWTYTVFLETESAVLTLGGVA